MKLNIQFDKFDVVLIDEVVPNPWNPKDKNTEEYKILKQGIERNGLLQPVVTRNYEDKYQIIDGEQRWTACKELGYEKIIIYNEGDIDDKLAQELTLWYQHSVPFNEVSLSKVVEGLTKLGELNIPFNQEKIEEMAEMMNFDWNTHVSNKPTTQSIPQMKTIAILVSSEEKQIVDNAFKKVRKTTENVKTSAGRCLELLCLDYFAQHGTSDK